MSANGKEEIDLQQYNPHDSATIADETGLRPAALTRQNLAIHTAQMDALHVAGRLPAGAFENPRAAPLPPVRQPPILVSRFSSWGTGLEASSEPPAETEVQKSDKLDGAKEEKAEKAETVVKTVDEDLKVQGGQWAKMEINGEKK